jgi:hypothetical protein
MIKGLITWGIIADCRHGGVSDISGFGPADNVGEVFEMVLRPKDKPADLWRASDLAVRRKSNPLGQHY